MSDYDSVNDAAAAAAAAAGWPDLTGAPKQIPWGITCRADKVRELEAADLPEVEKARWRAAMLRETRAGEWIDYRKQPWAVPGLMNFTEEERNALFG
ncbi:hypothetical protein ACFWPX_33580 [Nocardia sp. NPDC058518]|uniref:hypothetical protein n=1 Tax=Nocardia sp. NPDC058518 TaxID=3346534 RepID=UPI003647B778